jgi:hypothetical protein
LHNVLGTVTDGRAYISATDSPVSTPCNMPSDPARATKRRKTTTVGSAVESAIESVATTGDVPTPTAGDDVQMRIGDLLLRLIERRLLA